MKMPELKWHTIEANEEAGTVDGFPADGEECLVRCNGGCNYDIAVNFPDGTGYAWEGLVDIHDGQKWVSLKEVAQYLDEVDRVEDEENGVPF